jgi:hypothetical protein
LTDIKNISSALDFEFDPNQPEVIILEELTILAGQERWLYGLLEEARKASKLVVATSLKIDALEALEKRIRLVKLKSRKFLYLTFLGAVLQVLFI